MDKIGVELAREGLEILRGTKGFVVAQAPDFIRQVIAWRLMSAYAWLAFSVGGIIYSVGVYKLLKSILTKHPQSGGDLFVFLIWASGLGALVLGICGIQCTIMEIIKIEYAPQVYLMEYFAGLVK